MPGEEGSVIVPYLFFLDQSPTLKAATLGSGAKKRRDVRLFVLFVFS